MFDFKIPLLLFAGLFGILSINLKYQENKDAPLSYLNEDKEQKLNLYLSEGGLLYLDSTSIPKLINISSTIFKKIEEDFVEQDVVKEKHDIYNAIHNLLLNQKNKDIKSNLIRFELVDQFKDMEIFKSVKPSLSEFTFYNNAEIFVYRSNDQIQKIKMQSKAPFNYEDKSIRELKSYLLNSNDGLIQNTEVKYKIENSEYKLLIRAVYQQ